MQLPCPMCGEPDANIAVELATPGTMTCHECDAEFAVDDLERLIRQWAAVIPWLKAMPVDAAG